jgi:hypothetical protein
MMKSILQLSTLASTVSATGILLPLYIYPSINFRDNASNWQPGFAAIEANPGVSWQVVIDPNDGPGNSGLPGDDDDNYKYGVSRLNGYRTSGQYDLTLTGYVHVNYSVIPEEAVRNNITIWNSWSTDTAEDISVQGIFFDESPIAAENFTYMNDLISFARSTFVNPITVICNFGNIPAEEYYSICDIAIAFESGLNLPAGNPYRNQTTIDDRIPNVSLRPKSAVLVHDYNGTTVDGQPADEATLASYIHTLKANNVGWAYFVTGPYSNFTTPPADIGTLARLVATA